MKNKFGKGCAICREITSERSGSLEGQPWCACGLRRDSEPLRPSRHRLLADTLTQWKRSSVSLLAEYTNRKHNLWKSENVARISGTLSLALFVQPLVLSNLNTRNYRRGTLRPGLSQSLSTATDIDLLPSKLILREMFDAHY